MSNTTEDTLDLMCDEFKRIKSCCNNSEVEGLCDRAISEIQRRVPIVTELEQANKRILHLTEGLEHIVELKNMSKVRDKLDELIGAPGADADGFRPVHPRMANAFKHAAKLAQEILDSAECHAW